MFIRDLLSRTAPAPIGLHAYGRTAEAHALMRQHEVPAVVVWDDDGRFMGLLGEHELIRMLNEDGPQGLARSAYKVMRRGGPVAGPDDTVHSAVETLLRQGLTRLPVVEGGRAVAILTLADLADMDVAEAVEQTHVLADQARAHLMAA